MALLNRNLKWKEADEVPLIENDLPVMVDIAPDPEEAEAEAVFKKHNVSLWPFDAVVLVFEHLQYYAILLSLSERWGFPMNWVKATAFTFLFNFDIWEFRKVQTGAFNHSRASFIETKSLGFNYASYLASWAVLLLCISIGFSFVYFRWMKRRPLYLLLYVARWKRVLFMVIQLICIPFGVAAARVFHCRYDPAQKKDVMDVQNEYICYSGVHISFMILVGLIFFGMFILYPFILSRWISEQVFSKDQGRHEGYLQLKEAEYEQGLDILWDTGQYHLFSSFRRSWVYYNALKFIFKLVILAGFAFSVKSPFWSSAAISIMFFLAVLALLIQRPFRVKCFSFMIIVSHLCLAGNSLLGNFMVRPPWEDPKTFVIVSFLRYPTILHILIFINTLWVVVLIFWCLYMAAIHFGLIKSARLWPRLSYDDSNIIGEDTKKYLKAALKARHALEHALSAIPLFAPVHELSHQIKVINAYCREAEYIEDPTHDTLWDLLDELIEAHNALSKVSVFGMSGKNSIRETSEEFIKLMPSFKKRLAQREYDFILVPPLKRRLLLKMYVLGVFINGKKQGKSVGNDVAGKVRDALKSYEDRSLSGILEYDTSGFGSAASMSDRGLISEHSTRPISERGVSALDDRSHSVSVTNLLRDVDAIVGASSDFDEDKSSKHDSTNRPGSASSDLSLTVRSESSKSSQPMATRDIAPIARSPKVSVTSNSSDKSRKSLPLSPLIRDANSVDIERTSTSPYQYDASSPRPESRTSKQVFIPDRTGSPPSRPSTAPLTPAPQKPSAVSRRATTPAGYGLDQNDANLSPQRISSQGGSLPSLRSPRLSESRSPVDGLELVMSELPGEEQQQKADANEAPQSPERMSPRSVSALSNPEQSTELEIHGSEQGSVLSLPGQVEDSTDEDLKIESTNQSPRLA